MRALTLSVFALLALASATHAQEAVTATCKDGTSWSGARRSGACRGHQGVASFAPTPATPAAAAATLTAPNTAAPAEQVAPVQRAPAAQQVAPGGGGGQVWVNTTSKVYHCPGDRYYGKTKAGTYMSEAAAKAAGDRADHGRACS